LQKDVPGQQQTLREFQSVPAVQVYHILYANNLYGWSMSQHLPTGGFKWLTREEIDSLNVESVPDDSTVGYFLEVHVHYPKYLHRSQKDLPFLCERNVPPGGKLPNLLTTLDSKKKYTVHYRVLKQALAHGLKLTKIHRAIRFINLPGLNRT
jgi:hypothetical protein